MWCYVLVWASLFWGEGGLPAPAPSTRERRYKRTLRIEQKQHQREERSCSNRIKEEDVWCCALGCVNLLRVEGDLPVPAHSTRERRYKRTLREKEDRTETALEKE